jgi:hypothetical protein
VPLLCDRCGLALEGGDDAALFICPNCGLLHEPSEDGFHAFAPLTASATTELAVAGGTHLLAVWRLAVSVSAAPDSAWEHIRKATAPELPYLYVPAFSLMRPVVQRLGVSLTEVQPELDLSPGLAPAAAQRPTLVGVGLESNGGDAAGPGFGTFSPVVVGRRDARILGHFVYLAVESHEVKDLRSVDYELEVVGEDLLFIPAAWDPRYIHESNWRLLLREFDGLVA